MPNKEPKKLKVAITSLGCKVNQYEAASFHSSFEARGVEIVPFSQVADIYVINTCAVTNKAGAQSRQAIRRVFKKNDTARVIVTGCYSQVAALDILEIVDQPVCIVGNGFKHLLVDFALATDYCDVEMYMADIGKVRDYCHLPVRTFSGRTRAYLKIQDGCDNYCSYCIVPMTRGRSRSELPEIALGQARMFVESGYKEIVVTGIHVGKYGLDLADRPDTLASFLDQVTALNPETRFRLSSLEPNELRADILALFATKENLMPHFHIPLQSGDDRILKRMNRHYTTAEFKDIVTKIHTRLPAAALGIDVLVGFPGEDDQAFQNTYDLLNDLPFTYLHVFPFSRRPGTAAAQRKDQVAVHIKDERVRILRALSQGKQQDFYRRFIGTSHKVLAENKGNKLGLMRGFTENYIPVYFDAPAALAHTVVKVRIDRVEGEQVFGSVCP
ncbi:MAG: tRNA (N(6)-L-threonylcarbamoyladenosine(37)-C(2))-methylthiotransferase MtaB [Proteobacteria bacterium]|nr:tRNA (N(6)-L-threonylcarbamoyladenosine(37)-C(2))-methylthiotransferase MtaB [Pseudomonadota bacterium]MBU1640643.1 tRNA (N(6)-L-threonylcarbamoyladenosine(37)-C(2))-methylthiotransferase MtaB [Pseudomonadota bacterium]